jgi:hypothetical protein
VELEEPEVVLEEAEGANQQGKSFLACIASHLKKQRQGLRLW